MTIAIVILTIVLSALLWRVRGGWFNVGSSTVGRFIPAVFLAGMAYALTLDPWMGLVAPAVWLGTILPWARWMDMGVVNGSALGDLAGMTGRGLVLTVPLGVLMYFTGYAWYWMFGGALMGAIYWLAWQGPVVIDFLRVPNISKPPYYSYMVDGPTSIGELGTGALLGGLLCAAVVS